MGIREVIVDAKKQKSEVTKIREERATEAEAEYKEVQLRRLIAEERARMHEAESKGQPIERDLSRSFTSNILQLYNVDPQKAKELLNDLGEENMNKLITLMAAENDRTGAYLRLAQSPGVTHKDLIDILKFTRSNGGMDLKGIAEIFNAGVNAAKANQPQTQSMEDNYKFVMGIVKPFYDTLATKDQQIVDARLKEIESKIVNPVEWFQQQKTIAGQLGFESKGGKSSELDLKIEDMRERHDLDMKTLEWEQNKYMLGKESDAEKWTQMKEMFSPIFSGPEIRDTIKKIGESVGKSFEGAGNPTKTPQSNAPTQPQVASFICPECKTEIGLPIGKIPPDVQGIKCMKCGTVSPIPEELKNASAEYESPPPPEEKPVSKSRLKPIYR